MKHALTLAVVLALHVTLALRFEPLSVVLGKDPIATIDYDTHYEQTIRALEAYRDAGRLWGWDPHLLAGSLSGAIFDADTRLHELFTIALAQRGVPPARGYNLFILLVHLLVAPVIYASARLFRLRPGAQVLATALASACWYFDAFSHWVFWVGMISDGFAAYLSILPLALFYRWVGPKDDGGRRPWHLAAFALALAVIHHVHPYSFFVLAIPLVYLWVRARGTLSRLEHAAVIGAAAFTLATNLWWLSVAIGFWHYILDSAFYLDATLAYVAYDWLGFLKEPSTTGVMAARTGFRVLALGGAAFALAAWRRTRDPRFGLFAVTLGALLGAAYLGGYLAPLRQVQPYRFALPAMFLAAIPAAAFLVDAAKEWRTFPRPALALLAVALLVGAPRLIRDVLYFLPEGVPRHATPLPAPPPNINGGIAFGSIQWPEPFDFRHFPIGPDPLSDWVRAHDAGRGRWLVEWWMLGERLAWSTDAQVLGGFRELNLAHSDANLFRRYEDGAPPDPEELRAYLERYAVQWVVVSNPKPALEARTDLLKLEANVFGTRFYRTTLPLSWFEGGDPKNATADVQARLNHLTVRGSTGGDLTLRYHWMETLQCRPAPCTVERALLPGWKDRVGFIRVRNAPPDFEIFNGYRMPARRPTI
jgi:hypothetical protein